MARVNRGSGGRGGATDDRDDPDDEDVADTTTTESTTRSTPDPNDGTGLESRGTTETTSDVKEAFDKGDDSGSDPEGGSTRDTSPGASGTGQGLDRGDGASSGDTSSPDPDGGGTGDPADTRGGDGSSGGTEPTNTDRGGERSFVDRVNDVRDSVASGAATVRDRFTGTGSDPQDNPEPQAAPNTNEPRRREFSEREQQAIDQFVANNDAYDREDVASVDVQDDGQFSVTFTESGQEAYLNENFEETERTGDAPEAASQLQSGEGQDATVVFDQGVEAGEGAVADQAKRLEQEVLDSNPGLDESDVVINLTDDNQFEAELTDAGVEALREQQQQRMQEFEDAGAQQPDNAVDPTQRAQERFEQAGAIEADAALERIDRADEIGGDATTAADRELQQGEQTERVRQEVVDQLEEQGVDIDRVDVDVDRTPDGFEASVTPDTNQEEQFGDYAVTLPGLEDDESRLEEGVENTVGAVASPFGPNADELAEAVFTATGVSGRRFENVAGDASDEIQGAINENADAGGDAIVSGTFSQMPGLTYASADAAREAFEQGNVKVGGFNVSESLDQQSEGFFVGATSLADVPGTVVGAKEGAEAAVWASGKVGAGKGGEVKEGGLNTAEAAANQFRRQLFKNPNRIGGQVAGSLVGSVALMGGAAQVSKRAGAVSRYAIQPGEEVLTGGASSLASRSSRVARAVDELPGGRLDNEEIVLELGRRAKSRVAPPVRRARYDLSQRVSTNSDSSMRSILSDEASPTATDGGSRLTLSEEVTEQLRAFARDQRGSLQMGKLESNEVELEETDVEQPDAGGYEPDRGVILEDSPRDMMSDDVSARALDDIRSAEGDYEATESPWGEGSRQDQATFDPDEIQQPTDLQTRPSRGRGDAGQDFSGYLERRRAAQRSEVRQETELQQSQRPRASELSFADRSDQTFESLDLFMGVESQADTEVGNVGARGFEAQSEGVEVLGLESEAKLREDTDTVGDLFTEFESEQDFQTELESETEFESETEIETEIETESELEKELEWVDDDDDDDDVLSGSSAADDVFDTGVVQSLDEL